MRMMIAFVVVCCLVSICAVGAQNYKIDWYSINSGGGASTSSSYGLNASIGQSAAGFTKSTSLLHWVGFWSGDVPNPTVVGTVSDAKLLADGVYVSVAGKIATTSTSDFSGFFYLEEADRSNGIRVAVPGGPVAGLVRGSIVNVIGTIGTTADGERQLTGPLVVIIGTNTPLTPLGMTNHTVGGSDVGVPPLGQYGVTGGSGLNNIGLLIRTWGQVSYADSSYMLITDGSTDPIKVSTAPLAVLPAIGDYISVIGISSLYTSGVDRLPLVLPRNGGDVIKH